MSTTIIKGDKPKRKPGGQPGNTNALKHGLYAGQPLPSSLVPAEVDPTSGLHEEIARLLKVQHLVYGESNELEAIISQAISNVSREMNLSI